RDQTTVAASAVALFGVNDPVQAAVLAQYGYDVRTDVANPKVHSGIIFKEKEKEHGWATIDRVMNPDTFEFLSSKPPLLSTLLAGIYWILFHVFKLSIVDNPVTVVRVMLVLVNAVPFAGYLWLVMQVAERWGKTDWGKLYIVAAGAFATTISPFLITLQNHTFGAFAVMVAWWSVLRVWDCISEPEASAKRAPAWQHFVSAGFFSSFAFTMEMPALSFLAAAFVLLVWWRPMQTLIFFAPAALVPPIAFFATNHIATGQFRPVQSQFKSPWYRYEGSHWNPPPEGQKKTGIDWAKDHESRGEYVLHVLVGHHGLFSLTPIWLLAVAAMLAGCWHYRDLWRQALFREPGDFPWFVQPLGLALTIVVTGFYIMNDDSRNYGGFTNGLRWLMWLTPIWLTCLIPLADRLAASKGSRWFGGVLLAISVFSASYQLWSPWRHPWIFDLMIELGWKGY
ncbi:MAG: hypothetical protein HY289_03925, partial [Planctomycetes bacterium]|nr:hypothetical protein [Planctomycetota bacterium]